MTASSDRKDIAYVPLVSISEGLEQLKVDKKWKWPSVVVTFWIITLTLTGVVYFIDFSQLQLLIPFNKITELAKYPELPQSFNSLNGYLINTPGCRIPEMAPYDPSVKDFIFKPQNVICNKGLPPLFESNLTLLSMNIENVPLYNTSIIDINCCYKEFWRQEPTGTQDDIQIAYSNDCIALNISDIYIDKEFVSVICKDKEHRVVYEDYFAFVPLKKKILSTTSSRQKPNILVLGLDAVSRVNLHRQLPETYKYLTKKLDGVELLGYNKVADNTFVNLVPVLTGMFQSELEKYCWPTTKTRFDKCPFLWQNFSRNNYITAFGEDCAWIGIFNYEKKGFVKQPTDYYYTSFDKVIEGEIGEFKDFNCVHCVGGRYTYEVTLDYIRKFVLRMKLESLPYFGFFWGSALSHDYLNKPALGDQTYYNFLSHLKDTGHLENTILIFMSDHGIRWGKIRQTYQGQMEERLPFVIMVLPTWFKESYPTAVRNLNKNIRRLTTPFDLHETFKDLLDLNNLKTIGKRSSKISRGYSLFKEVPTERTCEDAEIDSHWCTCQHSVEVPTNDTQVIAAAEFAINDINSQLDGYAQCATLVLDSILHARVLYYNSTDIISEKMYVKDYTITLKTMPGEAVFEVTVRFKDNQQQVVTTRVPNRKRSTYSHGLPCQQINFKPLLQIVFQKFSNSQT